MTHFKDFSVCTYFDANDWLCRLIAVGWIEKGEPFEKGEVNDSIVKRLILLREEFSTVFPSLIFRGLHSCSICSISDLAGAMLEHSNVNLFIPHRGFVFVAPACVDHYISVHNYLPPESFIESLLACPSPSSIDYRSAMAASNRGIDAPIFVQS
jgi:hypothetical protein